jgi:excisionase family DNA binding protein
MPPQQKLAPPRIALSPSEVLETGAVSNRTKLYELLAAGELKSWREGKRRLIEAESLYAYVSRKLSEAA